MNAQKKITWQEKAIEKTRPVKCSAPHFLTITEYTDGDWAEITNGKGEAGLPPGVTLIGTCAGSEQGQITRYFVGFNE